MAEQSLTDIIQETLAENPISDNLSEEATTSEVEVEETLETDDSDILEDILNVDEDEGEVADDDEEDEEFSDDEEDDDADGETFAVKVDGEVLEVSLQELKSGYQRQADYTRKSQALAAEKEEFEQTLTQFESTIETLRSLDSAWDENPVQVLAHFTANTDNPTQAVAMLIRELAVNDMLDQQFMDAFGITPDVKKVWSQQTEVDQLRSKANRADREQAARDEEYEFELAVQAATAEYDRQIDEILVEEGVDLNAEQRQLFRAHLAGYARENDLTNLKAAYKSMRYEQSKQRASAEKAAERAKQKKSNNAVARSSSGGKGSVAVNNGETDLSEIIRQSMRELGGDA